MSSHLFQTEKDITITVRLHTDSNIQTGR